MANSRTAKTKRNRPTGPNLRRVSRRPKADATSSEHEGGYGRPPKEHQFKPGQSGNPKGRPKGSLNVSTYWDRHLSMPTPLAVNGQQAVMPAGEAIVLADVIRAIEGKEKSVARALAAMEEQERKRIAKEESDRILGFDSDLLRPKRRH